MDTDRTEGRLTEEQERQIAGLPPAEREAARMAALAGNGLSGQSQPPPDEARPEPNQTMILPAAPRTMIMPAAPEDTPTESPAASQTMNMPTAPGNAEIKVPAASQTMIVPAAPGSAEIKVPAASQTMIMPAAPREAAVGPPAAHPTTIMPAPGSPPKAGRPPAYPLTEEQKREVAALPRRQRHAARQAAYKANRQAARRAAKQPAAGDADATLIVAAAPRTVIMQGPTRTGKAPMFPLSLAQKREIMALPREQRHAARQAAYKANKQAGRKAARQANQENRRPPAYPLTEEQKLEVAALPEEQRHAARQAAFKANKQAARKAARIAARRAIRIAARHAEGQVGTAPLLKSVKLVKEYELPHAHGRSKQPHRRVRRVIKGVTMAIKTGQVHGLMGLSGAGKSTLVGMLAGLLTPTSGEILVNGEPASTLTLRSHVALALGTDRGFYANLPIIDNMLLFGTLLGLHRKEARERADQVLELVGLEHALKTSYGGLSSGMRRQAHLARALLTRRPLLIADEPTRGLDPSTEQKIVDLLGRIKASGQTMLLVTHDVHLASELCDRVSILESGQIIRSGTPLDLVHLLSATRIYIRFHRNPDAAVRLLEQLEHLTELHAHDNEVHVYTQDPENDINDVVKILVETGIPIAHIDLPEPGLEEVFLKVIAERKHEQDVRRDSNRSRHEAAAAAAGLQADEIAAPATAGSMGTEV